MKKYFIVLFVVLSKFASAQNQMENLSTEDMTFLFRVKTIEDFIYRFNNDSISSLRIGLKAYGSEMNIRRDTSLKLCFNLDNQLLKSDTTTSRFAKYVLNPANNCTLHFTDSNWFCKAKCSFTYKGSDLIIPIVLNVRDFGTRGMKWLIVGIDDNRIFNRVEGDSILPSEHFVKRSISATNYAVNFLDLNRIFNSSLNEKLCFDAELLETEKAKKFINLIKSKQLEFSAAYDLSFYFLQIPNYILEVNDYNRNTTNSGWLINKVISANELAKNNYKTRLLKR